MKRLAAIWAHLKEHPRTSAVAVAAVAMIGHQAFHDPRTLLQADTWEKLILAFGFLISADTYLTDDTPAVADAVSSTALPSETEKAPVLFGYRRTL